MLIYGKEIREKIKEEVARTAKDPYEHGCCTDR